MTPSTERRRRKDRKIRNERLFWWFQDITGVLCLFGIGYGLLHIPLIFN
jgi:hypothetical protein